VKIQSFVTPDGQSVHRSAAFRGCEYDKAMFDQSGVVNFPTDRDDTGQEQRKSIMSDLGYLGIQKTGAWAMLPHKRGEARVDAGPEGT
jgi:hypothetical protein